jgi:hypothetical protein
MTWSVARIEKEILHTGLDTLALPPEAIVSAVERVERVLGAEWLASATEAKGILPAMNVITIGLRLSVLNGIDQSEKLLEFLRRNDQNAAAELTAIYLFRSRDPSLSIELEPDVGSRKADFRVRRGAEPWTTVEVTQPGVSDEQKKVRTVLLALVSALAEVAGQFSLQVIFRREPTDQELSVLRDRLPEFCGMAGPQKAELVDGMGYLFLNQVEVGRLMVPDIPELTNKPKVGLSMFTSGGQNGGPRSQVTVQIPFTDERGDAILHDEARQLPKEGPGLVMINVANSPGNFDAWASFILPRFQPALHTRVSGVCLFSECVLGSTPGYDYVVDARLLVNPHAKRPLPGWIGPLLASASQEFNLKRSQSLCLRLLPDDLGSA